MRVIDGQEYLSTEEAVELLKDRSVTEEIVRDWRRRGKLASVIVREGKAGKAYHRREDLERVERETRQSKRGGRPRRTGVQSVRTDNLGHAKPQSDRR